MIYSSLAVLALSASAVINPFTHLVHMHPKQPDTRVYVALYNNAISFRDVTIGGRTYTVFEHETLYVKAPAGTVVYAGNKSATHNRGDALVEITDKLNNQRVDIN